MYQRLVLIGRLGADPILKYTPNGKAVVSFSVATDRRWTDAQGQQQECTTWFRVNAWERLAETCNQYLGKGRLVFVEGEIEEPRVYQDKSGEWRSSLDVRATTVKFLGGRADISVGGDA